MEFLSSSSIHVVHLILFSITGGVEQLGISATFELAVQGKKKHTLARIGETLSHLKF